MDNAFTKALGVAGNVADATFLGGTIGKNRRRNAFMDMVEQGDFQGAEQLALRNRESGYAQYAAKQGADIQQAQQAEEQLSLDKIGSMAFQIDQLPAGERTQRIQELAPVLVGSGILGEGDVFGLIEASKVDGGLTALYRTYMSAEDQIGQRTTEAVKFGDTMQAVTTDNIAGTANSEQIAQRGMTHGEQTSRMNAMTARTRASTPSASVAAPSSVREYQYFDNLSPEDQQRFMQLQRGQYGTLEDSTGTFTINKTTGQVEQLADAGQLGQGQAIQNAIVAQGQAQTDAQINLGQTLADAQKGLDVIDQMVSHENFNSAYGASTYLPAIRGTGRANVEAMRDQLGGQAFLQAFESLKGGGHITEIEGQKATQAVTRAIDPKQSPDAARQAWAEFSDILRRGMERAKSRASGGIQTPGLPQPTVATPGINGPSPVGDNSIDDLLQKYGIE